MGVGLPKIDTDTLSLDFSSSTSSTKPLNEAKGPLQTFHLLANIKTNLGFWR